MHPQSQSWMACCNCSALRKLAPDKALRIRIPNQISIAAGRCCSAAVRAGSRAGGRTHTAAYWLMLTLRGLAPRRSFWRAAQFDTIRLCLIKVAARVTEIVICIRIALPTAYPYQLGFAMLACQIVKLPP
jgi:hypothetical protein